MKHKTYEDGILYKGDCLKVLPRLIEQGIKVDAIITDIPYGTTGCQWDSVIPLDKMWNNLNQLVYKKTPIVLFSAQPFTSKLICSNINNYKYSFYWEKDSPTNFLNMNYQPGKIIEDINVFGFGATSFSKKGEYLTYNPQLTAGKPYKCCNNVERKTNAVIRSTIHNIITTNEGTRLPVSLIKFHRDKNKGHPTQKPIALMEYLINTYSNEGDTILDFTCGSGSTLVACRNTKRKFIGIELDESYYNLTKKRLKHECRGSIF